MGEVYLIMCLRKCECKNQEKKKTNIKRVNPLKERCF